MLEITCIGTPAQIGTTHGSQALTEILRSITFYKTLFHSDALMDWSTVQSFAMNYQPYLTSHFPHYVEEMEGVAQGAGVSYSEILALNVRTEIAFGAFSDGCTALSWRDISRKEREGGGGEGESILAQNWDWNTDQAQNLISLRIKKDSGLVLQMITEAGIIGKIGLNSSGVGCTLNALKAHGVSFHKLPCHLALRTVLESSSRENALSAIENAGGVATACHILIADGTTGGTGLECSSADVVRIPMNESGIVTHTNHALVEHVGAFKEETSWVPDTRFRLERVRRLLDGVKDEKPSVEVVEKVFVDEVEGDGAAICRSEGKDRLATLFGIVMDLKARKAYVKMGRPVAPTEKVVFEFD